MTVTSTSLKAFRIRVDGTVQGVGFRPYIYRLAIEHVLNGWVINRNDGVLIHVQGESGNLDIFMKQLGDRAPKAAKINIVDEKPVSPGNYDRFMIKDSLSVSGGITGISPDISVCSECLEDIKSQVHRKGYPLVNCTSCGPRFSIITRLPYDRANTSMGHFTMCADCGFEYHDANDRRFHAQPVACNNCGPVYSMETACRYAGIAASGKSFGENNDNEENPLNIEDQEGAAGAGKGLSKNKNNIVNSADLHLLGSRLNIEKLCKILESGGVITLKGTGGYNLVCDAMNFDAVERIREIKGRYRKPFAVMFRDADIVMKYCTADEKELEILQSWQRPVVLLRKRKSAGMGWEPSPKTSGKTIHFMADTIASNVSGGLNTVGTILPYMPFHYLLFERLRLNALVYTSANLYGDPILADDLDVRSAFYEKTDALVYYSRDIINPVDDSVCRVTGGNMQILRRSRGYVPGAINLSVDSEGVFAAGSDLKNTFAIGKNKQAILSQHNGDLENYKTFSRYRVNIEQFFSLFSFKPALIACDMHPDYHSAKFAENMAEETGSTIVRVQHHHAHIASCMVEHGLEGPVLGVAFDGTGFGDDGNIWGSEFMICDYFGYERYSHFSYIPIPGGDIAIKEPWRIAISILRAAGHRDTDRWIDNNLDYLPEEKIGIVEKMIANKINTPLSCSAGRLFDAVAALTGVCREASYDGEAPMLLESICCPDIKNGYAFSSCSFEIIDQVMADMKKGTTSHVIASRFHNGMANAIYDSVSKMHKTTGINKVVLSGGVFQNSFLLNRLLKLLLRDKLVVYTNVRVPVNDGGLALGQMAIAAKRTGH